MPAASGAEVRRREAELAAAGVAVHDGAAHPVRAAEHARGLDDVAASSSSRTQVDDQRRRSGSAARSSALPGSADSAGVTSSMTSTSNP